MSAMEQVKKFASVYWGVLVTLAFDIAGLMSFPECLTDERKTAIISVSVFVYVTGFMNGSKKTHDEMELEKERAVEDERANTRALEDGLKAKTEQYEHERTELIAKHNAEVDAANHRHTQAILAKESEINKLNNDISHLESQIADSESALQREREKSAELTARIDAFESEEHHKREMFDALNEREKWILAAMVDVSPKVFSASGSKLVPVLDDMCGMGIVKYTGDTIDSGVKGRSYSIALNWRTWLVDHSEELPDPHSDMPE